MFGVIKDPSAAPPLYRETSLNPKSSARIKIILGLVSFIVFESGPFWNRNRNNLERNRYRGGRGRYNRRNSRSRSRSPGYRRNSYDRNSRNRYDP